MTEPSETATTERIAVGEIFREMPLTAAHWKAGAALFIAFVIDAWEMMIVVLTGSILSADLHLSPTQLGTLLSAIYVGMIPGCLLWGKLTDRYGRKKTIVVSLALYGVLSLGSAFLNSFTALWIMRFLCGMALSGVLVSPFILLEELLPLRHRGSGSVCLAAGWPIGLLLAVTVVHFFRGMGWHVILAISSIVGLWSLVIHYAIPESPYWAASRGRQQTARQTIHRLNPQSTDQYAQATLFVDNAEQAQFRHLFNSDLLRPTILQFTVNTTLTLSTWALATWLPELLSQRGLSTSQGDTFIIITALMMLPGYFAASWATKRFGRKPVMTSFLVIAALAGFFLAASYTIAALYIGSFFYYFFNQGAWGVWDAWMGELYPTSVRGVGYSSGLTVQRVANSIAPIAMGILISHSATFAFSLTCISALLIVTVLLLFYLPETGDLDLE